ncbi:CC171 protein, partial [Prunella himalayana]|nr:CC171 protein [Prunella himalayana]
AILQQEIFEYLDRLHAAELESYSLHMQLAECRQSISEMQKDSEKAHRLQEQLNELQHVKSSTTCFSFQKINQDNTHKELDNALQREHEARLLLQEHQQRLRDLISRLESHSFTSTDRIPVSSVPLMNISEAVEELRRRGEALDHQMSLLQDTEQYRQQLQQSLQEAEHAVQQGPK